MTRYAIAAVLLASLLQACATPKPVAVDIDSSEATWTIESILQRLELPEPPAAISAVADLSIQSPLYTGGSAVHLKHRINDSILVAFTVRGLGLEAARLLVTPDSFFLYNRLEQSVTVGSSRDELVPAMFSPEDAMRRMLGLIKPDEQTPWALSETPDGIVLRDAEQQEQWIIDPSIGRVVSYERSLASGQLAEAIYFSDFAAVDSVLYPRRVVYRNPPQATNGLLQIRSITFSDDVASLALGAPPDAKRMVLE